MSQLARKLIAQEKIDKTGYLDIGMCGITDLNDIPELFDCIWLETLIASNVWWRDEGDGYIHSKNKGTENQLSNIPQQISQLKNLTTLRISGNYSNKWETSDYSFLLNLGNLQTLDLSYNRISDYSFLLNLSNLQTLDLSNNKISDISFLANMQGLQSLYLSDNRISDYSFLSNLRSLQTLDLSCNKISDISFLANLGVLLNLYLRDNKISDISSLAHLSGLQTLGLSYNKILDISSIANLSGLQNLNLRSNEISDINSLTYLISLQTLNLSYNKISDISFLANLSFLQTLNLRSNQVSAISYLTNLCNLQTLNLSQNKISDITPLQPLLRKGIPFSLKRYDSDGKVNLNENPLTVPPTEIVKQGNKAILAYFEKYNPSANSNTIKSSEPIKSLKAVKLAKLSKSVFQGLFIGIVPSILFSLLALIILIFPATGIWIYFKEITNYEYISFLGVKYHAFSFIIVWLFILVEIPIIYILKSSKHVIHAYSRKITLNLTLFRIFITFIIPVFLTAEWFSEYCAEQEYFLLIITTIPYHYFVLVFLMIIGSLEEEAIKEQVRIISYYTELIKMAKNYLTSDYELKQDEYEGYIADYLQRNPEYSSSINTLKQRYATVRRSKQEVQAAKAEAETKRLLKLKQAQEARQEAQTFKKAEAECIAKVKTTNLKLSAFTKAIDKVNNADYLTEEVKSKYLLQLNRSKELYTSYAENYASTYFRLHLAKIKKEINIICTNVYTHKHEIDGDKLAKIASNFEVLIKHPFNKLSNKHNTEITEISRLISDLTKLDKQEELEAELSGLLPVKDLKITQGKALEEALEKADLQSVETIDVILSELKTSSSIFEKELSRLEAENDVLEQFGE